jgi:hypothetical protein
MSSMQDPPWMAGWSLFTPLSVRVPVLSSTPACHSVASSRDPMAGEDGRMVAVCAAERESCSVDDSSLSEPD